MTFASSLTDRIWARNSDRVRVLLKPTISQLLFLSRVHSVVVSRVRVRALGRLVLGFRVQGWGSTLFRVTILFVTLGLGLGLRVAT